jgi:23S rRNA (uracil1939-C5)-methyltransferase
VKKKQVFQEIEITDLSSKGKGVTRINDAVVFVDHCLPGDVIDLVITRKRKGYYDAKLLKTHHYSSIRTPAFCSHFGDCGGCKIQNMQYSSQLDYKYKLVQNSLKRIAHIEHADVLPILGSEEIKYYRNKLEYSFSTSRWLTEEEIKSDENFENKSAVGFHVPGRYDKLIDVEHCYLQAEPSNKIRNFIREYAYQHSISFYNPYEHHGELRSLFVRNSNTGEVMINLVFGEDLNEQTQNLLHILKTEFPEIHSFYYLINPKKNDSIYDLTPVLYSGASYIIEQIEHIQIKIGPKSFYQTNSRQSIQLYRIIREFGEFTSSDVLYDLYAGVGSIGLFLAKDVNKVIGIETIEEAVLDATDNMHFNKISNAKYVAGQVEHLLSDEFAKQYGVADSIIIDPPRPGIHKNVIEKLLELEPKKIIYVSCNPATQARDIELLAEKYDLVKAQAVDMFPHTLHVENVALLKRKI